MQSKIRVTDTGHWEWIGARQSRGYGCFVYDGKAWLVHRLTYTLLVGPIPDGLQNDHLCKFKPCCNPAHLEPVTQLENMRRTDAATKTHCLRGHPLGGENLVIKVRPNGSKIRNCKICKIQAQRDHRARSKAAGVPAAPRRPLTEDDSRHGTLNGYTNYRCRCEACSRAAHLYRVGGVA